MASRRLWSSAARTAAPADVTLDNLPPLERLTVVVKVTVASGTGGLTPTITGYFGGLPVTLLTASAAITATGTKAYVVGPIPGAVAGGITQVAAVPIPDKVVVSMAAGDGSSYTYEAIAELEPK
jgi:hypothetical protein